MESKQRPDSPEKKTHTLTHILNSNFSGPSVIYRILQYLMCPLLLLHANNVLITCYAYIRWPDFMYSFFLLLHFAVVVVVGTAAYFCLFSFFLAMCYSVAQPAYRLLIGCCIR